MEKEKLLVSACFLSDGYKYDGTNNIREDVLNLQDKYELVPICPEVFGELSTPRLPSEQKGEMVFMNDETDVTANFILGSQKAFDILKQNNIKKVLLKAKSPSCGYKEIYDGTFTHTLTKGHGVFVKMLLDSGLDIQIYTENDINKL